MRSCRALLAAVATLLLCGWPALGHAHKASDAFLELGQAGDAVVVRWDIALRDLDQVLDLDLDGNGTLEWGEIEARQGAIRDYAFRSLRLSTSAGSCHPASVSQQLARRQDGAYAVLRWRAECLQPAAEVDLVYRLLENIDPTHRVIVSVPGAATELRTLRPSLQPQALSLRPGAPEGGTYDLAGFFLEGFRHILDGFDHLAFLLALLIPALSAPAVSRRRLAPALGELLAIVSVFTLAHSLTLALTALQVISLPSRLVESLIALSVIVAGAQALQAGRAAAWPARFGAAGRSPWLGAVPLWLVFTFGLVHGMGFGAALGDSGFGGRPALSALLGFNLGVEAGQLTVVALVFPLAWLLKSTTGFRRIVVPGAAMAVIVAGSLWFLARAFDLDLGLDLDLVLARGVMSG